MIMAQLRDLSRIRGWNRGASRRGALDVDAGIFLDDVEDDVGHGPVDVGNGQEPLDEAVEVLALREAPDDEAVPVSRDIVHGGHVGVLSDPLLGLDELALGDADSADGREANAKILRVDDGDIAVVDPEYFGVGLAAVIAVRISKGKLIETQKRIAQDPHVAAVYDVTGDWDCFIVGRFAEREDLNGFVKGLLAIPHVDRTVTHVVLNVVKEDPRVHV